MAGLPARGPGRRAVRYEMKAHLQLGPHPLGRVPLVVGVISSGLTLDRLASGFRPSCDVVEFRADLFGVDAPDWLPRAIELEQGGLPVLLTIRDSREGGRWFRSERERMAVYTQVLPFISAVDVELNSPSCAALARAARERGRVSIGSFHDFAGMPDRDALRAIVQKGRALGVDIVKIAALASTADELARLEALLPERGDQLLCVLGMGPFGPESRLRLARAGSCLTYGYADESNAPGQLSCAELMQALRTDRSA